MSDIFYLFICEGEEFIMKKKFLSVLLSMTVVAALAAGCGSNSDDADKEPQNTADEQNEEDAADDGAEETANVEPVEQRTVYVTPEWVKSVIDGKQSGYEDAVIAEVTYSGVLDDSESYKKGHIPGAILVGDTEVEDAEGTEEKPYNLLTPEEVESNMLSHGITKDTKVILYGGDVSGVGRVAYAYLWAGVEDVKILNGGLNAWEKAGYELETDVNEGTKADSFGTTVPAHPEFWVSIEDAKDRLENDDNFKLVSIRSEEEWLGKSSGYNYIERGGEPEGAVWGKGAQTAVDVADFTESDGRIKDLEGFKKVWEDCDFTLDNHLSFYCGTGWRATVPFLVLYENGYDDISVYDGGWYEWQMRPDYPVQVGDPASDDCEHTTVGELPTDKAAAE